VILGMTTCVALNPADVQAASRGCASLPMNVLEPRALQAACLQDFADAEAPA